MAGTAVAIPIRGLDHVVLRVADVDRSIAFYGEVLGCAVERRLEELGLVQLRAGSALIDLVPIDSPLGRAGGGAVAEGGRNVDHFALELIAFDDDAIRAHLAAHGVEAGDTGRRYGAGGFGPSMYLSDPDGNVVELKGPADDGDALEPNRSADDGDALESNRSADDGDVDG